MSKSKYTDKICVLILLLTLVLTTVFMNGAGIGIVSAESDITADQKGVFSDRDFRETWSEKDAVMISLDNLTGFMGNGAYEYEGDLYLVDKGTYVLSGQLKNQQIIVKAKGAKLQIVLNGVQLEEEDQAALVVEKADKVFLTLAENTENSISVGTIEDADGVPDAAIYSKSDLSINGKGSLKITTEAGHGIKSKDDLVITNGRITVDAGGNGIVGKDSVRIADGEITITTSVDAVNMNEGFRQGEGGFGRGGFGRGGFGGGDFEGKPEMQGGMQKPERGQRPEMPEGMQMPENGGMPEMPGEMQMPEGGERPEMPEGMQMPEEGERPEMPEGMQMPEDGEQPEMPGGFGGPEVPGESSSSFSKNQGIKSDGSIIITGGTVTVAASYEGIEANQILISGGVIDLTASDDGMNASESDSTEEKPTLQITGGTVHVNASGDGLDSNGNLIIDGGSIIIDGPENGGNGALDSGSENGGDCVVNGGTLLALGASGMAESFTENSTQYSFHAVFDANFNKGDQLTIRDSEGSEIFSYTIQKSGNSAVFTSPELKQGETYQIQVGDQIKEMTMESISNGASFSFGFGRR